MVAGNRKREVGKYRRAEGLLKREGLHTAAGETTEEVLSNAALLQQARAARGLFYRFYSEDTLFFYSSLVLQCLQGFTVHFTVFYSVHMFLKLILQHFTAHFTVP